MKPLTSAIVTFLFVAAVALVAVFDVQPPEPLPATAPDSLFSADRAAGYIREVSSVPHPLGSTADASVRSYIVTQLRALGLTPKLDTSVVTGSFEGLHYAATVINISARIAGSQNTKAVLLMAHYDSVPTGPGASDDGSGVATILETLRALRHSTPLRNDVLACFTDGEEEGMMGAQALSANEKELRNIGVALNFEARGTSGPSIMFESSEPNRWLINSLAGSAPSPVATSLAADAYKRLPNNTDFSWLKSKGIAGLNFAFIGSAERYHSMSDNFSNIDVRSIQHDGSYSLSLTKAFGNMALPSHESGDDIYFNFFWPNMVHYPANLNGTFSILAAIIYLLMLYVGIKKGVIRMPKLILGMLLPVMPIALFGPGTYFLWKLIQSAYPESQYFIFGAFYGSGIFLFSLILLALGGTTAFYIYARKFFRSSEMAAGVLLWWLILTFAATQYLPHGAYFFQWPLIFSSFALLLFFLAPRSDFRSPIVLPVLLVGAVPGIYLAAQMIYFLFLMGALPIISASVIVITILSVGTILPHIAIISSRKKWLLPIAVSAAALLSAGWAIHRHTIDTQHPKSDAIDYGLDLDDSTAYWLSPDESTDEWTSQFMRGPIPTDSVPDFFPGGQATNLASRASAVMMPAAAVSLVSDSADHGAQSMTLLVKPSAAGQSVVLSVPEEFHVISASVNGHTIPDSVSIFPAGRRNSWILFCPGIPDSGYTVRLLLPAGQKMVLESVETIEGIPQAGRLPSCPRPGSIIRRPFVTTDASLVMKTYTF